MYYAEKQLAHHNFSQTKSPSGFFPTPSSTLATRGYNSTSEARRLNGISDVDKKTNYLLRNLKTTVNHLYEDSVVSFTNHYQLDRKGEIITYPDGVYLHLDPEERGDLYRIGLTSAVAGAIENPHKIVTYYSPPGPIVFDDNPENKYLAVDPYKIGQLYLMYFDGEKVNNVAVGISRAGESWVKDLMPYDYQQAMSQPDVISRIKHFITHPVLHDDDIDSFFAKQQNSTNRPIYKNKDGIIFSLDQTLHLIRQSLDNKLPHSDIVNTVMRGININHITPGNIAAIYHKTMALYMRRNNLTSMTLGGSCGGKEVSLDSLYGSDMGSLTTDFRMLSQNGIEQLLKTKDTQQSFTFEHKHGHACNKCGTSGDNVKLGPCDICQTCQAKFDSHEFS